MRSMRRNRDIRPDTAHAIGGTAELALPYSIISAFSARPKHHYVMTTGKEHGQRHCTCRGGRTVYGTMGRPEHRTPPPNTPAPQDLSGTTGRPRAADAAADSAGAAVLLRDYGSADGLCWSTPRLDHAPFLERADASVRCSGFEAKPPTDKARSGYCPDL